MPAAPWRNRIVGTGDEDPTQLLANPRNWRTHPKEQREALRGALSEVGWVQQVLVNKQTGHVVDGHARVEEAITRGEPTVPVLYVDLTPDEEGVVLASLDPIGAMAARDDERLTALLAELHVDDAGLQALLDEIAPLKPVVGLTDPDDVPPLEEETHIKRGDIFALGDHRLMCGDSANAEDVARLLAGATPRLLVTDPPYGVSLDPTWRDGVYNKMGPAALPYMTEGHGNRTLSGDTVADWSHVYALVPSIEVAYVWHAGVFACEVGNGLKSIGFEIRSQIIWVKTMFAMGRGAYQWQHEPCWFAVRKGKTSDWLGDHKLSTTWELASPKSVVGGSKEEKFDHPAQKPIECMQRPIEHHAGDVYEPFLGSGTTLVAAERVGRRCYAMEIDPRYVAISIKRWEAFTGKTSERLT